MPAEPISEEQVDKFYEEELISECSLEESDESEESDSENDLLKNLFEKTNPTGYEKEMSKGKLSRVIYFPEITRRSKSRTIKKIILAPFWPDNQCYLLPPLNYGV